MIVQTYEPGQGNNAYIFPGAALGIITAGIHHISGELTLPPPLFSTLSLSRLRLPLGCRGSVRHGDGCWPQCGPTLPPTRQHQGDLRQDCYQGGDWGISGVHRLNISWTRGKDWGTLARLNFHKLFWFRIKNLLSGPTSTTTTTMTTLHSQLSTIGLRMFRNLSCKLNRIFWPIDYWLLILTCLLNY